MQITTDIRHFPGSTDVELSQVGGKALSLMKTAASGLPVPPGFVLTVDFFEEWLTALKKTSAWNKFLDGGESRITKGLCDALKEEVKRLRFSSGQKRSVREALEKLGRPGALFAVRSSSPEEDLEGSSFAGGYETILGVSTDQIEDAVLCAFASCLDARVVVYKTQHGFSTDNPKIAVVVQLQVASDVAGVGFSLNPVSNHFDEAVISANWGLGETVVAGLATPDAFIVDKTERTIVEKTLGSKELSIWLEGDGGTYQRPSPKKDEFTLSDEQVLEVAHLISQVEELYQKPMDIEWAISNGELYLLQARPITTHCPLPIELLTKPGEKHKLYLDATISVQGLYKPLSVMGTDFLRTFLGRITSNILGKDLVENSEHSAILVTSGRLYMNVSNIFNLVGRDKFVSVFTNMDPVAAGTISLADEQKYKPSNPAGIHVPFHLLWHLPEVGGHLLEARVLPEHAHRQCCREIEQFKSEVRALSRKNLSVVELVDQLADNVSKIVFGNTMPLFLASRISLDKLKTMAAAAGGAQADIECLEKSLPNNPTIEMGLSLYQLSRLLPEDVNLDSFEVDLANRTLPEAFLAAWDDYMERYGHRGAVELDIRSARYRDLPRTLLDQLMSIKRSQTDDDNPQSRFDRNQMERHAAFERLCETMHDKGWLEMKRFTSLYRVFETLGGYREMHKYLLIYALDHVRRYVLNCARDLVEAGRLDTVEQVFDLTFTDLGMGLASEVFDLRRKGSLNRRFSDRLAQVPQLPVVFDSRGLILRPPQPPAKEGEAIGTPISSGVKRGPVKVLHAPDEKPLEKGEILVARATDPGWTPLFVNAAAVVLEVGGVLQHGALVAREYGLPCVAGISGATGLWQDGTIVEVDGSAGIVRIVE